MWKKLFLDDDHLIFQSQLVALLKNGHDLPAAAGLIESKAPHRLRDKIARAGTPLLPGLAREGLISPELASLLGRSAPAGVKPDVYLRRCLDDEVAAGRIDLGIRGQFSRVFLLFGVTTLYALVMNTWFRNFVSPMLRDAAAANFDNFSYSGSAPQNWLSGILFSVSLCAMLAFLATLSVIYLALKLDGNQLRERFGFLLRVPFVRGIFRKRATHRVLAHCSSMLAAGASVPAAVEASLGSLGLASGSGTALFPSSALLDPLSVEALNLGSGLGTFEAQLDTMLAFLQQDIPYTAQKVTRVIYYTGYVCLGVLVGSLLMQMYGPIFQVAAPNF